MTSSPANSLDDFKALLPIGDVVGRFVKLQRNGREMQGLCPFHQEKTPSFTVVEDKGFYHCFGCGAHGNAIDFVMAVERLEFADALKRVAELTGIQPPRLMSDAPANPVIRGIADANQAAIAWFQAQLAANSGKQAQAYLHNRKLDPAIIKHFGLGYAPVSRTALRSHLEGMGFATQLLIDAGLVSSLDDGSVIDRFRDRIMFPIFDARSKAIGFGGRALGDAKAKYLNTSDTPAFHKGSELYWQQEAGPLARRDNRIVVAEGYMDVIAFYRAGIKTAVAPLGTAVTEDQLNKLWRYADEPTLCLDADEAGKRAAVRTAKRALPILKPGKSLQFAILPEGEDPDSLLDKQGPQQLEQVIEKTVPMIDILWQHELAAHPDNTPERRAQLKRQLVQMAASVEDSDIRYQYQMMFRERLDELWQPARRRPAAPRTPKAPFKPGFGKPGFGRVPDRPGYRFGVPLDSVSDLAGSQVERFTEMKLIAPLLHYPDLFLDQVDELVDLSFDDPALDRMRIEIFDYLSAQDSADGVDAKAMRNHLTQNGYAQIIAEIDATMSPDTSADHPVPEEQSVAMIKSWRNVIDTIRIAQCREEQKTLSELLLQDDGAAALARIASLNRLLNEKTDPEES